MAYKTKHPLYNTYRNMKARCYNKKAANYKWYGGQGVKVCDRWRDSFPAWLADMGPKPDPKHVLIRLDVAGDYEPGNCVWGPKGSDARRRGVKPVEWEYALRWGERVSKPLGSLQEAKDHRRRIVAKEMEKGHRVALGIVRRAPGGEWQAHD